MSVYFRRMEKTSETTTGLAVSAAVASTDVSAAAEQVLERFAWASKHVPGLLENLADYTTPEALDEFLVALHRDGLIENTIDALDAIRVSMAKIVAIRTMDLAGKQVKRLQVMAGSFTGAEAFQLKAVIDAVYKANKTAQEIEAEAGFGKRTRAELNLLGKANDMGRLLDEIMNGDAVPETESMAVFLSNGRARKDVPEHESQLAVFEDVQDVPLNPAELTELLV